LIKEIVQNLYKGIPKSNVISTTMITFSESIQTLYKSEVWLSREIALYCNVDPRFPRLFFYYRSDFL